MTFILNILISIILILIWFILIFLFAYQIELKRRFLFSILPCLSVATIPEEEVDYTFDSSSEKVEDIKSEASENNTSYSSSQDGDLVEGFTISKKSKSLFDIRLDLISNNNSSSAGSSNEVIESTINNITDKEIGEVVKTNVSVNGILPTSTEVIEKGLKIKPNLHLDLSSITLSVDKDENEIVYNSISDILPKDFDASILEAFIPFPELATLSNLAMAASMGGFKFL